MLCQTAPSTVQEEHIYVENVFQLPNPDYLTAQIFHVLSGDVPDTCRSDCLSGDTDSITSSDSDDRNSPPGSLICSIPFEFTSRSRRESPSVGRNGNFGSTKRKQRLPQKSASKFDPKFRGAVVTMETQIQENEPVLVMKSEFRYVRRVRVRRRLSSERSTFSTSDSEDERYLRNVNTKHQKRCISCGTKTTPLWRDIEKTLPLCNACGIRYKKYKIRCSRCWHVPRRNRTINFSCISCGAPMQFNIKTLN